MERPNGPLCGERPLEFVESGSNLGCRLARAVVLTRTRLTTRRSGVARQRPQAGQGGDGRASVAVAGRQTHEEAAPAAHHLGGYVERARLQSLAPAGAARLGRVLTPDDFTELAKIEARLAAFERSYEQVAAPVEWRFSRDELALLMKKLANKPDYQLAA